jgi:hypothetical protein
MHPTDMTDGIRVRIVREIELGKIGKFPPGLLGTVHVTGGDGETEPFCLVKLDGNPPELEKWDFFLQVWSGSVWNVTADDFDRVVVEE